MTDTQHDSWYCLKAKTKREHIAASILREKEDLTVFCPRISIIKQTVRGPKAFTEALFPGYVFCKFNFERHSRRVQYSQNIIGIVKFGEVVPAIPEEIISRLQESLPEETTEVKNQPLQPGDLAQIVHGCFVGELGTVTKAETPTQRINLLIEFLGNQIEITLPSESVINTNPAHPATALGLNAECKR